MYPALMTGAILHAIVLAAVASYAQAAPRCDVALTKSEKFDADWELVPNPAGLDLGREERQFLFRCKTCDPPVAVSIRTTDLTGASPKGRAIDTSKNESFETVFGDPVQKKKFADWYRSDIQRLYQGCEVQAELRETKKTASGISHAMLYFGAYCRGKARIYDSGIDYIGGRDTCAFRTTLLWAGKEPLPEASVDRLDELFGQLKMLPTRTGGQGG